jgi:arylsulfatase A-like enzyme
MLDELTADLALALLADDALALGRDGVPDVLCISFSAHDTVAHNYGLATEEGLDVMRRLDLQVGRVLDALDRRVGKGSWVLAVSADHGFNEIPELARRLDPARGGGRIVNSTRATVSFTERVNRALAEELCLAPGSEPIAALEAFSLSYDRGQLPLATVAGRCGDAGQRVGAAEIDAVLPRVVDMLYREEVEGVLLAAQHGRWPQGDGPAEFVRNHYDPERGGDAFLLPRPGVIADSDPARGTGHGTHHRADTHVPLVFLGAGVESGRSTANATPYDLAPTLAARLGVTLPAATGRNLLPAAP